MLCCGWVVIQAIAKGENKHNISCIQVGKWVVSAMCSLIRLLRWSQHEDHYDGLKLCVY